MDDVFVAHVNESELDLVVQTLRQGLRLRQVGEHLELGVTLRFEHELALAVDPFGRLDVDRERGPGEVVDRNQRVRLVLAEHQKSVWSGRVFSEKKMHRDAIRITVSRFYRQAKFSSGDKRR